MVSMTADLVVAAAAQAGSAGAPGAQRHWSLLARLENTLGAYHDAVREGSQHTLAIELDQFVT